MKSSVTIQYSVRVFLPADEVWDFTQDFNKRMLWDSSIKKATVIQDQPHRLVKIKAKWGVRGTLKYKLEKKPEKTSLVLKNIKSPLMRGGGGSWVYHESDGFTLWTQTNTLILKKGLPSLLLKSLVHYFLKRDTRRAMYKAKKLMEKDDD